MASSSTDFEIVKKYFEVYNRSKDIPAHSSKVQSVDWNSDGRRLASGSFDKTVSLFSFSNEKLNKEHIFKGFFFLCVLCLILLLMKKIFFMF